MAVRIESQAEPISGYRLIDRLGSGGFGEVWRAEAPGGIFKAIKIIHGNLDNRETDAYRFAEQELKALKRVKQVRHPYLLALDRYDVVDGRLMIVMELADCNLWDRFRQCRKQGHPGIPRDELLRYMEESAEVLDLMDSRFQLQHLDIKPQNLFLLYNHVKVADFGQVKDLEGMVASVTGGITPVYAAPETFDGFVSRFCDQYSLACVYQELLTGTRPFDGTSMQQLLMQHLQAPPNLQPSPPADRPALAKALAKRPEDRFPSVTAMVRALRAGGDPGGRAAASPTAYTVAALTGLPAEADRADTPDADRTAAAPAPLYPAPGPAAPPDVTPAPLALVDTSPPDRPAPPEVTGDGPVRPALVVALGYTGLRVAQRLRRHLADRFGPPDKLPAVRTLYVDTDPDALAGATADQPWAGLAGLAPDEVFEARLNRAGHYLKPRLNGRTLMEGWFDPQLLYKLPRNPVTMGVRLFGRLAFCDHYRPLAAKLEADLDACLDPQALADTQAATGLGLRTNRPRVYVVAGLGGGTGSGMALDVAYAVRARLKRIGYPDPDVVGVLLVPPDGPPGEVGPQAQANAYAALTELNHYARPDTVFAAAHDDRAGAIRDAAPPFKEVVLLPGLPHPPAPAAAGSGAVPAAGRGASGAVPAAQFIRGASGAVARSGAVRVTPTLLSGVVGGRDPRPASRAVIDLDAPGQDPSAVAAEFLRLDLLSPVGPAADAARPGPPAADGPAAVRTVGLARYGWPRAEVVARAARVLAPVLVGHWVSPDPDQVRRVIPGWAADQWARLALDPDRLTARLAAAGDQAGGGRVADLIAAAADPLVPKGWRARLPDPARVSVAVDQFQRLVGRPRGPAKAAPTPVEEAVGAAADEAAAAAHHDLAGVFPGLLEDPRFRLAGAEEAVRQVMTLLDRTRAQFDRQAADLEATGGAAFDHLTAYVNYQKGMRKPTPAELADALTRYPTAQHRLVVARGVVRAYKLLRDELAGFLAEVAAHRQRVEGCLPGLRADADIPAGPAAPDDLLPPGCPTPEDAAQTLLRSLTDDDLHGLDVQVQHGLERAYGGLYQACLNSAGGLDAVLRVVREEARVYLDARVGEVDLAGMFGARFGGPAAAARELARGYEAAAPALVGGGPWARPGVGVFAAPAGPGGDPVRALAADALPADTAPAEAKDEVVIYREYPAVPLAAVPQLGPAWAAAYKAAPDAQQAPAHVRLDVTRWVDVDSV